MENKYSKNIKFLLFAVLILILIVIFNNMASFFGGYLYYVFYEGFYDIGLSAVIPLIYVFYYEKKDLSSLGFKPVTLRCIIVAALFIAFSIGGQLSKKSVNVPSSMRLIYITIPLIMSTFFEEFLFRGFFQTRFEKYFGVVPSIILSGLFFCLYHLGYPKFRSLKLLITLFFVGIMFALSYKLSGNNLLASFLVNLPNAVLTYLLNPNNFQYFSLETSIFSIITMSITLIIFVIVIKKSKNLSQMAGI